MTKRAYTDAEIMVARAQVLMLDYWQTAQLACQRNDLRDALKNILESTLQETCDSDCDADNCPWAQAREALERSTSDED